MKTKIFLGVFFVVFWLLIKPSFSQNGYYFEKTIRSSSFPDKVSNQCVYINFPDVSMWGWIEVTITDSYSHTRTTGKLTKRFQIGKNLTGYFHQVSEVPVALGDVAQKWSIGELDKGTVKIPIYSLANRKNSITVRIEGVLTSTASVQSILSNLSLSPVETHTDTPSRLYQNINGSLSIGTTDPKGFKLAVNGSIRTKEVVVTADNWPDYVFQPEYHLRPLQEVEAHIHTHGHLPEVPSAQQVEENGVGLGEMNALLLKKVEELTLYSIEQERKLERQNEIVQQQGEAIEKLKRQNKRIEELEGLINGILDR